MQNKKFDVAISCLNKDIIKVLTNFNNIFECEGIFIHVIHQITDHVDYSDVIKDILKINNLRYTKLSQIGLPISRNYALSECCADYLIPTDSDVVLFVDSLNKIKEIFDSKEEVDYITLESFYDQDMVKPRRKFSSKSFKHNSRTLLSVSSIEIVLRADSFKNNNVKWDLDFGLGAKFGGGLETVMLQNAHSANLIGIYFPLPLSSHHELSTGAEVTLNRVFIRSAVFERIYGKFYGKFLSLIFHFKNYRRYRELGLIKVLNAILESKKI